VPNRRQFLKSAIAVAVSAAIPGSEYTYRTYSTAQLWYEESAQLTEENLEILCRKLSQRYAQALARSMMQTREAIAANVLTKAFSE